MAQHFLLSAAARSLSPGKVTRMSERGAENVFVRLRWPQTDGKPVCPNCGCQTCYDCPRSEHQPRWRCKACRADFSATSGTLFAWHKLPLRTWPENLAVDRIDRRLAENQPGTRQVVVAMRERGGRTLAQVFPAEADAVTAIRLRIAKGTTLHADESPAWNTLHAGFAMQRINHQDGYSIDGACTNGAESSFSRLRRGELGHHHHIGGPYLARYAQEAAWREDLRRVSNGEQVYGVVGLAMHCRPSVDFCGYWQRAQAA